MLLHQLYFFADINLILKYVALNLKHDQSDFSNGKKSLLSFAQRKIISRKTKSNLERKSFLSFSHELQIYRHVSSNYPTRLCNNSLWTVNFYREGDSFALASLIKRLISEKANSFKRQFSSFFLSRFIHIKQERQPFKLFNTTSKGARLTSMRAWARSLGDHGCEVLKNLAIIKTLKLAFTNLG